MRRISNNTWLVVFIVVLTAVGTVRLIQAISGVSLPQIRLQAAISHPTLLGGTPQTTYIKINLTGFEIEQRADRTPVNIALVLDKSGSMGGEKIAQAREAAIRVIDRLGPGDVVSVVSYDNNVDVLVPATEVGDISLLAERIRRLQAGGGTALYAGVEEGARQLDTFLDANRVNRVILLSDGEANEGPSTPSALGDLGASLIRKGISVTTIGLGLSYNEDLMTQLARRSDGNHSFVQHVDDLGRIFDQEFGDALSVVAQDVTVTIDCKEGIRPVRVLGRDARIEGQRVEVGLNQINSRQDKYIVLEVEAAPRAQKGKQEIADVTASYANMVTQASEVLTHTIAARITDSEAAVKRSVDAEAMVAVIEQQGVLNEEQAIRLRDQGRQAEAEQVLKDNAAFLEANAALYRADTLFVRAQSSLEAAANLEGARWNQQRKLLRSDHYKAQRQQSY